MYFQDEKGKWKIQGCAKILIEPSEDYLQKTQALEELTKQQELLDSLTPTAEEVARAELDLQIISILQEAGLI